MNSRERYLAAIEHKSVDRVPTDIWATGEVWRTLIDHFGSRETAIEQLHIDGTAGVGPKYVGPTLPAVPEGQTINYWGMRFKRTDYGAGTYDEQCHHPLADARSIDDLEAYRWPRAEWFDCSLMRGEAAGKRPRQAVACGYMAPFYHHNLLRGLEQSLMDPFEDPPFTDHLLGRITDFFIEHHRRMFQAGEGLIDITQVTDDFGTQTGPMISLETFRRFYRPHIQRCIDLARQFGIHVMHHDDGSIRTFLPDLVEMGIEILNPVQWRCPGMELEGLKRDFGGKLCFHGGIDNQQTLPQGTPDEVRAEVRMVIDALGADGTGYILAPCHNLQPVTPLANILAMYDEAWRYGRRS
jgi:uroporphyrinogen decarboxylase